MCPISVLGMTDGHITDNLVFLTTFRRNEPLFQQEMLFVVTTFGVRF